jgi:hypothetical protein
MKYSEKIIKLLYKLISDGHQLVNTSDGQLVRDNAGMRKWANELLLFNYIAGDLIKPWESKLKHDGKVLLTYNISAPLTALETVKYAIENDLLSTYRELIFAESFAELFEQGQNLFSQGYFLAAGVVFRAVLEEQLRKLCEKYNCFPEKPKPTINDFNQALYLNNPQILNKSMMLNITSLAAIGNDAAHNSPDLNPEDVERLMNGTLEFISRFSP